MFRRDMSTILTVLLILIFSLTAACSVQPADQTTAGASSGRKIRVLSTTTLVGDVVSQVGGDRIEQSILIPPGVDEHGFQPSPQDLAKTVQADLIFINGAGLEGFIDKLVQNASENIAVTAVSDGIELLEGEAHLEEDEEHLDEENEEQEEGDPHTWTDPNNVIIWVNNIEKALSEADPNSASYYSENANRYRQQLRELDTWVVEQVNQIPQERRKLVTDHTVFTYFASRYGFEQIGAVVPGYSTLAQPSAQQMAELEDTIRALQVPAVFVGNTINPALSERVAADTQTRLVYILTGSLTEEGGPGPTYVEYVKYNVNAIVEALK
jgi:manganese/iron transport system substrate-binding protein